ncbi:MAG: hypothetical protein NTZ61_04665 [Proteobacteria bacterium]|nr:hypothetical protein [Pseudomonadota bacterium]
MLVVAPDPDPVRILDLSYQPPGGAAIEVDFFAIGDLDVSSLTLCGITLSGSSALHVAGSGVGVIGGDGDSYVDSGETLGIELDQPTVALRYRPWSAIGGSPIAVPFTLEAFDAEAQSLGALPLSFTTMLAEVDVTALYAGAEIASFELVGGPPNQGGQGLGFVSYAVAPEPTTLAVGAAAGAALAALARKRARRGAS